MDDLNYKAEVETQIQRTNMWMDTKGEKRGWMNWEIGIDMYTLLILCIK